MKRSSPLKLGKETYGTLEVHEAFRKAMEVFFSNQKQHIELSNREKQPNG